MNRQQSWEDRLSYIIALVKLIPAVLVAIVVTLLFLNVVMGLGIGLVVLNERSAPDFPWFPIPLILLLIAAVAGMPGSTTSEKIKTQLNIQRVGQT